MKMIDETWTDSSGRRRRLYTVRKLMPKSRGFGIINRRTGKGVPPVMLKFLGEYRYYFITRQRAWKYLRETEAGLDEKTRLARAQSDAIGQIVLGVLAQQAIDRLEQKTGRAAYVN